MVKRLKRPTVPEVTALAASKYYARQEKCMSSDVRLKILERAVPKLTKHFTNGKCTFYDKMGIQCTDCPLNTLVGGLNCDLRAVIALLTDDLANESKKRVPTIDLVPFIEDNGIYSRKLLEKPESNRFDDIV
jgi:hypothetical protein